MSAKIIRDPLYNYVSIDQPSDRWLVELLDSPEVQRLRRIHQLGVSYLTYPGADHNRLAHSLGVLHLMMQAYQRLCAVRVDEHLNQAREPLFAAALVHDVGHGPFSHVFETCLGIDHEVWSRRIILFEGSGVHQALKRVDSSLPERVANLIDPDNHDHPPWQKHLLSSQLDVDRLDYLRRDSIVTGAGYGHFDWFRLINTLEIHDDGDSRRDLAWAEKSILAVEEYIFSRYYMYQNVYFHKTTRGFEKMLEAMWRRARHLHDEGTDVHLVPVIRDFWDAGEPEVPLFLAIEEFTVLHQIQNWTSHDDPSLSDLARRFLGRKRFAMVEPPSFEEAISPPYKEWEAALRELVEKKIEYSTPGMYCLEDEMKAKYNEPYVPEKEGDEQSVENVIRIKIEGEATPIEVSKLCPRLRSLTQQPVSRRRYYVPKELQAGAKQLRDQWTRR